MRVSDDKETPAEPAPESQAEQRDKITPFAKYTAPAMLAMLDSGGKDMAFAQFTF